jgi:hypothetical protein
MPQLLASSIGGVPVAWDVSANYLDVSNNLNVNRNTSVSGNVITSNVTGFASQSSLVTISGNLIIPSSVTTTGIEGQLRYNTSTNTIQFYNGSSWVTIQ